MNTDELPVVPQAETCVPLLPPVPEPVPPGLGFATFLATGEVTALGWTGMVLQAGVLEGRAAQLTVAVFGLLAAGAVYHFFNQMKAWRAGLPVRSVEEKRGAWGIRTLKIVAGFMIWMLMGFVFGCILALQSLHLMTQDELENGSGVGTSVGTGSVLWESGVG